ncbi:hypothetical protein LY76DRAFT_8835 [Colletotrichum caudatum]|nr:hypothetical protein LY76DRAFT_8835 [Colletotrichum caudatum]
MTQNYRRINRVRRASSNAGGGKERKGKKRKRPGWGGIVGKQAASHQTRMGWWYCWQAREAITFIPSAPRRRLTRKTVQTAWPPALFSLFPMSLLMPPAVASQTVALFLFLEFHPTSPHTWSSKRRKKSAHPRTEAWSPRWC